MLIGFLIKQGKVLEAISLPNFSLEKIKDRAGLGCFVGSRVILIGLVGILTAALIGLIPAVTKFILLVFMLATALLSVQAVLALKRFL